MSPYMAQKHRRNIQECEKGLGYLSRFVPSDHPAYRAVWQSVDSSICALSLARESINGSL